MRQFIIAVVLAVFLLFLLERTVNINLWIQLVIIYIVMVAFLLLPTFNILYFTRDGKKVEKFLVRNKKNPYYRFIYAIAHKQEKGIIHSYRKLLRTNSYKKHFPLLTIIFSVFFKNTIGLEEEIAKLTNQNTKNYYTLRLMIENKESNNIEESLSLVKNRWMKESLLAEIALKKGERLQAKEHLQYALQFSRGLPHYLLEKELQELKK